MEDFGPPVKFTLAVQGIVAAREQNMMDPAIEKDEAVVSRQRMSQTEYESMDSYCMEEVGLNAILSSDNESDSWHRLSSKAEKMSEDNK